MMAPHGAKRVCSTHGMDLAERSRPTRHCRVIAEDSAMNGPEDDDQTTQALAMLADEHRNAERLFAEALRIAGDPAALQPVVERLCTALSEHAEIEEEFFYPALRGDGADDLIEEAQVEHHVAKQLIADLRSMDADDERYRATVTVLQEYVRHHVDEEENVIFPQVLQAGADLEPLHEAMSARAEATAAHDTPDRDAVAAGRRRTRNVRTDRRPTARSAR
jgi:hemerythrin superfamily protein